jgi:hypothetical protein
MALEPTPVVLAALRSAAEQTNVPISLLWGIAFAESGFDPSVTGPLTAKVKRAQGLMQLLPEVSRAYGVTDPFDPAQSALGAAKLLAKLAKPLAWDVPGMLSAYVWGPTNYARAQAQGGKIPSEVTTYVRRALAARDVYRNKASRKPGGIMVALNAAIEALAALNPLWAPAVMTRDSWRPFFAQRGTDTDAEAVINPQLRSHWRAYQLAYERAPLTDESTPRPELVEPDLWRTVAAKVDSIKHGIGDGALGLGAGLFIVALFVLASRSR